MNQRMTAGLDLKLQEMAGRIRELREIVGLAPEDMARYTGVTPEEYRQCEVPGRSRRRGRYTEGPPTRPPGR